MDAKRITPEAGLLWAILPAEIRERAVNHAWCRDCRDRVALAPGWSGRAEARKLVIEGACPRCGARITRKVDAGSDEPPPN